MAKKGSGKSAPNTVYGDHVQVITPKYTGDPLADLATYQAAVQKVHPNYNLSQGLYSPLQGQGTFEQLKNLVGLYGKTDMGKKAGRSAELDAIRPTTPAQIKEAKAYGSNYTPENILNKANQQKAMQKGQLENLNALLQTLQEKGLSDQEARTALYYQLKSGQNPHHLTDNAYSKYTPEGLQQQATKTPEYQTQAYFQQQLMPQVYQKSQDIMRAARDLQEYQGLSSKGRTAFLAQRGYTSESDITRGMGSYLGADVPVTPENLAQAASSLYNNPTDYLTKELEKQAKARGTQTNDLNALLSSVPGVKMPQGMQGNPLAELIYLSMQGGQLGLKKNTGSSSSLATSQSLFGK